MSDFKPTDEQQAIVEATSGSESLMIQAYAGCAKTTTLELASKRIRVPALALAFNKGIADELKGRFAGNFTVKTMNGLGFGAWMRRLPAVASWKLEDRKLGKLISEVLKREKLALSMGQWAGLRDLVQGIMQAGISPGDEGEPLLPDTIESWTAVADSLGLSPEDLDLLYDPAREVLSRSIQQAKQGFISFDDQIYCPVVLGGKWPKFPQLLVDEAQDLNALQHRILGLSLREDGKLIACGDSRQSIYGFRGSHSDSMGQIAGLRPRWRNLPLAMTFRCPKVIVDRQQGHAPGFRAFAGNREGKVYQLGVAPSAEADPEWKWEEVQKLAEGRDVAVLCRNNGPLLKLAFRLIRRGIGCQMLGRDIGKGLEVLSRKLSPEDGEGIVEFLSKLTDFRDREVDKLLANDQEERVAAVDDKVECLRAVAEAEVRNVGELRQLLGELFSRKGCQITLSSIHKAKGLEWEVVLFLDPWRIPSKWARVAAQKGDRRELEQELNLRYVAETRTKDLLLLADLRELTP